MVKPNFSNLGCEEKYEKPFLYTLYTSLQEWNPSSMSHLFRCFVHFQYLLLKDEIGGDSMRDTIASWFWQDWNGETKIVPCKYDEKGMFYLTYDLCNYDAICLNDDGTVNVGYSNVPQIAKLIKPFVSKENGMRVVHNLYGR